MSTPFNFAATAYNNAAKLTSVSGSGTDPLQVIAPAQDGPDFGKMLADNLQSVVDSGKVSEQKSMDLLAGKADLVDVVTAISQTEMAVESMVTVRDKVISAYEEIMRMPI